MLISTLEELRLFAPSNAISSIDPLIGFINSSEQDFLMEKLGESLFSRLCDYYMDHVMADPTDYIVAMRQNHCDEPFIELLYLSQKAVTYDALGRSVNLQAVSMNSMGVNVAAAENYKAADSQAIADFKRSCVRESHAAINGLLVCLENWAKRVSAEESPNATMAEIVDLWRESRFFYRISSLLIPTATTLQEYYDFYESREKFIQMVPDLRYIQEDILAPAFGEDFVDFLAGCAWDRNTNDKHSAHMVHAMRKIMARWLETRVLKPSDSRVADARNEAVKLSSRLCDYVALNQKNFSAELLTALQNSPLRVEDEAKPQRAFENNARGSVMFVTPGLV